MLDLQAEHDPWRPPATRDDIAGDLGANRVNVVVIPDASHALIPEQPQAVVRAVLDWTEPPRALKRNRPMPKPSATPPFRADHVGSLLRPKALQEARAAWKAGTTVARRSCATWKTAASPPRSPSRKTSACAPPPTANIAAPTGISISSPAWMASKSTSRNRKSCSRAACRCGHALRVNGRIGWSKPMMIDDYKFLASHVRHARGSAEADHPVAVGGAFPRRAGGDRPHRLSDAGWRSSPISATAYHKAVAAFAAAGCRYLQLDEVNIAYLCDPEQIAASEGPRRARRQSAATSTPACSTGRSPASRRA